MDTTAIVVVVAVAVVLVLAVVLARPWLRRRQLRNRFGDEYDHVLSRHENRADAEAELLERERRHAELDLRPLSAEARTRYAQRWSDVQERFVDEPESAVRDADRLITALMAERGYPTEGFDDQAAHLSIEHSRTLGNYRTARETYERMGTAQVNTEDLRAAMVHYRSLYNDLLGDDDEDQPTESATPREEPVAELRDDAAAAGRRDASTGTRGDEAAAEHRDAAAAARHEGRPVTGTRLDGMPHADGRDGVRPDPRHEETVR
ncbi:MAG TPA: hypothetical protein VGD67_13860 [Pseudonocardiaceae bacterium]